MVENLIKNMEVVGVKAKQGKFVFGNISNFDELNMEYDVTVIPPDQVTVAGPKEPY